MVMIFVCVVLYIIYQWFTTANIIQTLNNHALHIIKQEKEIKDLKNKLYGFKE